MRDTDPKQDTPGLGKKIEQPPMPERHKRVSEHVWQAPDGKLYTEDMTPPPVFDIYSYYGLPRPT